MDDAKALAKAFAALTLDVRKATVYVNPKHVVSVCRRHKHSLRRRMDDFVVKVGVPNYLEVRFIAKCKQAGEPFPVKKVQLSAWPVKRK